MALARTSDTLRPPIANLIKFVQSPSMPVKACRFQQLPQLEAFNQVGEHNSRWLGLEIFLFQDLLKLAEIRASAVRFPVLPSALPRSGSGCWL